MHVVAAHLDHVQQVDQPDHDRRGQQEHPGPVAPAPPACRTDADDHRGQAQRQPQRVGGHEVPQVGGALRPPRRPRRLGQAPSRGPTGRSRPCGTAGRPAGTAAAAATTTPPPGAADPGPYRHPGERPPRRPARPRRRPSQSQLGTDERAEAGHDGGGQHAPGGRDATRTSSRKVHPEPEEDHRHLEARGDELPHPGDHRDDQQAEREHRALVVPGPELGPRPRRRPRSRPPCTTRPRTTEVHSSEAHGVTAWSRARVNIHRGSESTSTRSPTLKTGPVPGQQVVDDAEVDEGVLVDPPVGPGADQDDGQGDEHRPPGGERHRRDARPAVGRASKGPGPRGAGPVRGLGVPPACDGGDGSGGQAPGSGVRGPTGAGRGPAAGGRCRCTILAMGTRSPTGRGDRRGRPGRSLRSSGILPDGGGRRRRRPPRTTVARPLPGRRRPSPTGSASATGRRSPECGPWRPVTVLTYHSNFETLPGTWVSLQVFFVLSAVS